jgi:hypothetical protein
VSIRTSPADLGRAEESAWTELLALLESLTPEQAERAGYYPEGWSVKDLMAHIASWQAEAGQVLEQIWNSTFVADTAPTDEMNQRYYEANKDLPLSVVWAELFSSRTRMLVALNALPELTAEAVEWFVESGVEHYEEHLGRLQEWAKELQAA